MIAQSPTPTRTPTPTPNPPTATPTTPPTFTPTPTPPCIHDGDVDFNGIITAGDAQLSFYIVVGFYTPTYMEWCAADCNGDGMVTAADAQQIFGVIFGGSCIDPL